MRSVRLLTPWTLRYFRALCGYGFQAALGLYLLALASEQFRPGVFSLSIDLNALLALTVILGASVLLLPRPTEAAMHRWSHGTQRVSAVAIALTVAAVTTHAVAGWMILRVLIFAIVGVTVFLVVSAVMDEKIEGAEV